MAAILARFLVWFRWITVALLVLVWLLVTFTDWFTYWFKKVGVYLGELIGLDMPELNGDWSTIGGVNWGQINRLVPAEEMTQLIATGCYIWVIVLIIRWVKSFVPGLGG